MNPHLSEAPFRLGLSWFYVGNYEQASRQLAIAADMDPDNWQIHYYLGEVYKAQEHLNFAIREYIRAVELSPQNIQSRLALADASMRVGDIIRAQSEYLYVLELAPNNSTAISGWEHIENLK